MKNQPANGQNEIWITSLLELMHTDGERPSRALFVCLLSLVMLFLSAGFLPAAQAQNTCTTWAEAGTWAELQTKLRSGGCIRLTDSVTGPETNNEADRLIVPGTAVVTLDLNGKTVNRGLQEKSPDGYVISVSGTLNLTGSGTVTGGKNNDSGGGVYVAEGGTFTLNDDVTISGNRAEEYGGGVYVENGTFTLSGGTVSGNFAADSGGGVCLDTGRFTMFNGTISQNQAERRYGGGVYVYAGIFSLSGGTISENTAAIYGGGLYVYDNSYVSVTFELSGFPRIDENDAGSLGSNLFLDANMTITVSGRLTNTTPFSVAKDGVGVITTGLPGKGSNLNFKSEGAGYSVKLNAAGEAEIVNTSTCIIAFNKNGGSGSMQSQSCSVNQTVQLNQNTFTNGTLPFSGWNTMADGTGDFYAEQAQITPTGDTTLYAQWGVAKIGNDYYSTLQAAFDAAGSGQTVVLLTDIDTRDKAGYFPLLVNGDKNFTFDLNGFNIDRSSVQDPGIVINVAGTLTLRDGKGSGKITGGKGTEYFGGCVYVTDTFKMEGGTITGNTADRFGGGVYLNGNSFTLSGGTIADNSAAGGCGVYVHSGSFTMAGGMISNNKGTNEYSSGGGVYVDNGSFSMTGGTISGNEAYSGGGVFFYSDGHEFRMSGGTISGNKADSGGGIYVQKGIFLMSGNASIKDNTSDYSGGGVEVIEAFTMSGGTITGNSAEFGGGISNGGTTNISGGTITGNSAGQGGSGIFNAHILNLSGAPYISGNAGSNLYEASNNYGSGEILLRVVNTLSNTTPIGITMQRPGRFTSSTNTGYNVIEKFTADDPSWRAAKYPEGHTYAGQLFLGKLVTVSNIKAKDKDYDGNTDAELDYSGMILSGKNYGDDLNVTASGTFDTKEAGTDKTVSISGLTLEGNDAENYFLADSGQQTEAYADINPKQVKVTVTAKDRPYESGNTEVEITGASIADGEIISGETVTLDNITNAKGTMADDNPGTDKTVTVSGLALGGSDNGNYALPDPVTTTVTIRDYWPAEKRSASGSAKYGKSGEIDISDLIAPDVNVSDIEFTYVKPGGEETTEKPDELAEGPYITSENKIFKFSFTDEREYIGNKIKVILKVPQSTNYISYDIYIDLEVEEKDTAELKVTQEGITYGSGALPDPSYDKPAGSTETLSYTGTRRRDGSQYGPTVDKPTEAGSYKVSVRCETDETIYSGSADFTIAPEDIGSGTVKLGNALTYNGSQQTQAVAGLMLDGYDILEDCTVSSNTGTSAGDYTLTVTANENSNYTGTIQQVFTIAKAQVTYGDVESAVSYAAASKTVTLTCIPADAGKLEIIPAAASQTTGSVVFDGADADTDAKTVTISFSNGAAGGSIMLPVTVSTENYEDADVKIILTLESRADAEVSISEGGSMTVLYGDSLTLHASAQNGGYDEKWTWTSSDECVAAVGSSAQAAMRKTTGSSDDAHVSILKVGQTDITAGYGSETTEGSAVLRLTVGPRPINDAVMTLSGTEFDYDGTEKSVSVVSVVLESVPLAAGEDYVVSGDLKGAAAIIAAAFLQIGRS